MMYQELQNKKRAETGKKLKSKNCKNKITLDTFSTA
jgi:hypothetical protein